MEINNSTLPYQNPYLQNNNDNTLEKIASTLQINKASNNAASLSIAQSLKIEANGYTQALENANSAIASTQIASKAINEQADILNNVKQDLLKASNATTSQEGREAILQNIQKGLENFNKIASSTNYNGQTLLQNTIDDKNASQALDIQIGNSETSTIQSDSIQANTLGLNLDDLLNQDSNTFSADSARGFLSKVDDAINTLSTYRSDLGSTQNQLESSGRNLITQEIQTRNAQSEIIGANIAQEIGNFDKQNVLAQVGAYTQSQFNVTQQSVLRLLT